MRVVINISEEEYNNITKSDKNAFADFVSKEAMMYAIKNGTPLPKNHGRLIDADAFAKRYEHDRGRLIYGDNFIFDLENNAPPIIEAESEAKE